MKGTTEEGAAEFDPFAGPSILSTAPSTEPQREVWTAAQSTVEGSLCFNESVTLRFSHGLEVDLLRASFGALVERHEALRATFTPDGHTLCIDDQPAPGVDMEDWSSLESEQAEAHFAELLRVEVETPFDLERGPLFRVRYVRISGADVRVVLTAHHIVCDGWSTAILIKDWATFYNALREGRVPELPPAEAFSDYARAQAESAAEGLSADEAYWTKQLAGELPILELPSDRPRPPLKTFAARRVDSLLDPQLVQAVRKAGSKLGGSLFTTLLAAFKTLLFRLSGQDDLVVGIPTAGQAASGHDTLVGHCVNMLPLRSALSADLPFAELLKALRGTVLDAQEHQALTFGALLKKLPIRRDPSRLPLLSVAFNLDRGLTSDAIGFSGVHVELETNPRRYENFDLFLNAVELPKGVVLECQYSTALFEEATIRRWLTSFARLLSAFAESPSVTVGELALLSAEDEAQLARWNEQTQVARPSELSIQQLIEAQVRATPAAIACSFAGGEISYRDLDERANQLARRLIAQGVQPGTLVGLCVDRSANMLIGMLGILKAGGAYVPLDPDYPEDRLAFMIEDSRLAVIVAESRAISGLSVAAGQLLLLDKDAESIASEQRADLPPRAHTDGPAYVIYTSGSTGKPKGVLVPHRAVVNLLQSVRGTPGMSSSDVVLAITTLSFDIALSELILPLTVGARIVLVSREVASDGARLLDVVVGEAISFIDATPATYRLLLGAGWQGSERLKVICTGEAMPPDLARELLDKAGSVWNGYGPTETTVWSTFYRVTRPVGRILIGRPIDNTRIYILDARLKPVLIGVPGEIYIGGAGVALGYLHRPELTAERFLSDPFASAPGQRMYKTGDLGRYLSNGEIECLGRNDNQVKLRGHRIELGEIENALGHCGAVAQAAVIVREDQPGDARLVGYVRLHAGTIASDAELRAELKRVLPDYMVPASYVRLAQLPLTPSGKIDRKALPAPDANEKRDEASFIPARSEAEKLLAGLWQQALRVPRVSVDDDFFALGGHSLLASQILARLRRDHDIDLSFRKIFEAPTIASLAALIESGAHQFEGGRGAIARRAEPGPSPLSVSQERIWMLEEMDPSHALVHNLPAAWCFDGDVDVVRLQLALDEIAKRHELLRTTLKIGEGRALQVVADQVALPIQVIDLGHHSEELRDAEMMKSIASLRLEKFDLQRGPLFRSYLFRLVPGRSVYFTLRHNLIWDGWSFDIFLNELTELYGALAQGRPPLLPELPIAYADFVAFQREFLKGPEIAKQVSWWRQQLTGRLPELALPCDRPRPSKSNHVGGNASVVLSSADAAALTALGRASGATLFMVLVAAYTVMLHRHSGQHEILVGTPVRGRNRAEIEGLIGPFINAVVLRAKLEPSLTFSEFLSRVRTVTLDSFSHQDMPLELLGTEPPVVRAFFSLQDARDRPPTLGGMPVRQLHVEPPAAGTDIMLWMMETRHELIAVANYSTELFDADTIARFLRGFARLLAAVIEDPARRLDELPIAAAEDLALAQGFGQPEGELAWDLTARIDAHAATRPEAAALSDGSANHLGYAALRERADGVAALLSDHQVGAGKLVAVCSDSSIDRAIGLLGALRAGAAFMLLDPTFPPARNARLCAELRPDLILASHDTQLAPALPPPCVRFGAETRARTGFVPPEPSPWALACVTYVFDARGGPLPSFVSLAGLTSGALAVARALNVTQDSTTVGTSRPAATLSLFELLVPLLVGARAILPGSSGRLARLSGAPTIDLLFGSVSSLDRLNLTELAAVRSVVALGEPGAGLLDKLLAEGKSVFRLHAFREAELAACVQSLTQRSQGRQVGQVLFPGRVRVVDARGQCCPTGVGGEIEATSACDTLPASFRERTGTLQRSRGRLLADATVELAESTDGQVEFFGHGFAVAEIGSLLERHPSLLSAAAVLSRARSGAQQVSAFIVVRHDAAYSESDLRRHLREELPDFMIPQAFVEIDAIPMTDDGELDLARLPGLYERDESRPYVAPRTDSERLVGELFCQMLKLERLSIHDNFFELGGHSLLCFKVLASLEQRTGARISPRVILLSSLEQVAAELSRACAAPVAVTVEPRVHERARPQEDQKPRLAERLLQRLKSIARDSS